MKMVGKNWESPTESSINQNISESGVPLTRMKNLKNYLVKYCSLHLWEILQRLITVLCCAQVLKCGVFFSLNLIDINFKLNALSLG